MDYRMMTAFLSTVVILIGFLGTLASADSTAPRQWHSLDSLGLNSIQQAAFEDGFKCYDSLISLLPGIDVSDTTRARFYFRRGYCLLRSGNMAGAEADFAVATEIYGTVLGTNNGTYGTAVNALGATQQQQGKLKEAANSLEAALSVERNSPQPDPLSLANALGNLALLYELTDEMDKAKSSLREVIELRSVALGDKAPEVLVSIARLGEHYRKVGQYREADSVIHSCIQVIEADSTVPADLAAELETNYGNLRRELGDYREAEQYLRRSVKNWEKSNRAEVWQARYNLALLLHENGEYLSAEPLLRSALSASERNLGPLSQETARLNNALGSLCLDMGQLDEAAMRYDTAIAIWSAISDEDIPEIASALNNKANLLLLIGEPGRALASVRRSVDIQHESQEEDVGRFASTLETLAHAYLQLDSITQAKRALDEAVQTVRTRLGESHPLEAYFLITMAEARLRESSLSSADSLLDRADSIYLATHGATHPERARLLQCRAQLSLLRGLVGEAAGFAYEAYRVRLESYQINAPILSEREALRYARSTRAAADNFTSIVLNSPRLSDGEQLRLLEVIFSCKNLASRMLYLRSELLKQMPGTESTSIMQRLNIAKSQLADKWLDSGDSNSLVLMEERDSLANEVARLEKEVSIFSTQIAFPVSINDNYSAAIKSTSPEAPLLYYILYDHSLPGDPKHEQRFLVAEIEGPKAVNIFSLGPADEIDSMIQVYLNHLAVLSHQRHLPLKEDLEDYNKIASDLSRKLLPADLSHVKGIHKILVSPDAAINLVSFAGLPWQDGYLVEKAQVMYADQVDQLSYSEQKPDLSGTLLAVGNPDFDASVADRKAEERAYDRPRHSLTADESWNTRSGCGDLRTLQASPLYYTQDEVDSVAHLWSQHQLGDTKVLTGVLATEDSFKRSAPFCRALHLSTHGFMLQGSCAPQIQGDDAHIVAENPLLLSGLLLAGANLHGAGADSAGIDDGILTALEISSLDLDSVSLVVLSACESGLGTVEQGEGVYGLRRAFQMAGADAVVSSLWSVPDKVTADLMSDFYQSQAGTASERLREAQLKQIKRLREMGVPDHPYSWAAFIATGN